MRDQPAQLLGLLFALAAATAYGCNISFARLASFEGLPGTALVFYRVFAVAAFMVVAVPLLGLRMMVPPAERGAIAVLGLGTVVVGVAYLSAVAFIPVTVAVVIFYTFPILIVLASPFVEGTRPSAARLGLALAAFVGVVMVVGPVFRSLDPRGLTLAAMASLGATVQFFAAARCRHAETAAKVFWVHVIVLPATAIIGFATGAMVPPAALLAAPVAVVMTIGGYVVGFVLQLVALARAPAVAAGLAFCLEPVVAALTSTAVLGERLTPGQIAGGALVLAVIVTNVILEHRRCRSAAATGDPARSRASLT
ncbi:EamA family transporter [Chelatococcus sp. SYSU_G07232]|uniref:EamA family transporter n=1 Tax=Chelatococcus albus TaxID=3047466 RepID=A0ABT7AE70_9HYPH|nr:EamA family transporter [Chelatococcus sp. SYSU_G07232]MDJ1157390.1 EamA family transporter [Chelatococcus sp. SYSU_G07232]